VTQAQGSAYLELGDTKVVAAVHGYIPFCIGSPRIRSCPWPPRPRDATRTREYSAQGLLECEFKFAPFASKTRRGHQQVSTIYSMQDSRLFTDLLSHLQDDQEKELGCIIGQTLAHAVRLEKYPKSRLDLFVTVLEDAGDGAFFCSAPFCAYSIGVDVLRASSRGKTSAGRQHYLQLHRASSRGVRDARPCCLVFRCELGSAFFFIVWKTTAQLTPALSQGFEGGRMLVDPAHNEQPAAVMSLAYLPSCDEIAGFVQTGVFPGQAHAQALEAGIDRCSQMHPVVLSCLHDHAVKILQGKNST